MRDYFCSRSTMQLPSTENNFRQHLLHHNTSFLAFSINELKKQPHVRARPWDICLISMYEVILLMSYCWRSIVSKNRLPMRLRNDLSFSKIALFHFVWKKVKFPHSLILQNVFSSWIEKTMTKQYVAIGKTDLFCNRMGLCGNFTISQGARRYQSSRSEGIYFHSFGHHWTCFSRKRVHSSRHLHKNK